MLYCFCKLIDICGGYYFVVFNWKEEFVVFIFGFEEICCVINVVVIVFFVIDDCVVGWVGKYSLFFEFFVCFIIFVVGECLCVFDVVWYIIEKDIVFDIGKCVRVFIF